jgi:mRNA-degrading endonuclease HigB of HigAB toxin-antitoxin module
VAPSHRGRDVQELLPSSIHLRIGHKVGRFFVFDIGGNKFRLIAAIHFNRQILYIRHVLTHREYDAWEP